MPTTKTPPKRGKSALIGDAKKPAPGSAKKQPGARKSPVRKISARRTVTRTRAEAEPVAFESGTGSVFADMGARDADERLAKAELARIVRGLVRERQVTQGWTQAHAARVLGIKAPDMSNLLRGKLAGFSQERLAHFLTRLGMDVRIQIAPRATDHAHAAITVERVAAFA